MVDPIPPLREGLLIEQDDATGAGAVYDQVLGQKVRLDAHGIAILRSLDREQSLQDLADRLDVRAEALAQVIGVLRQRHLLQDADSERHVAESNALGEVLASPAEEVPLLIRPEAAFSCTLCGSCCGGHNIGPVLEDTRAGIEAHGDELVAATGSARGLFVTVPSGPDGDGAEQVFCHSIDGSCVFLTDERRCLLHQRYGAHSKPRICRLFPYTFTATPKGIAVSISQECRGYAEARHGRPLSEQTDELRALIELVPRLERTRPMLRLTARQTLSYEQYEALEGRLHEALDANATDPSAALLAMRAVLLDEGAASEAEQRPPGEPFVARLDDLAEAIAQRCEDLQALHGVDSDAVVVRVESAGLMALAARRLRPDLRRVVGPLDRPGQHALFVSSMHQRLAGKELTEAPTLVIGLARMVLSWLLARALMIARARQVKRRHLVEQDVMDAIVTTTFLLRNEEMRASLAELDPRIVHVCFEHLPELLDKAAAPRGGDERAELFRF